VDTGFASTRAVLYGLVAHSGVPPQFDGWKEFLQYDQVMRDCKAIRSFKGIKWDIRPRPDFGTIEFRICDTPATIETAVALAALMRTLVIASKRLLAENPQAARSDRRLEWINTESKWLAARHGLEAIYIRALGGKRRALAQETAELIERLLPIARESGDHAPLLKIVPLDKFEIGADRQRRLYREHGDWQSLIQDSIARLDKELKPGSSKPKEQATSAAANKEASDV
jgi:carboxylate-amine ligase